MSEVFKIFKYRLVSSNPDNTPDAKGIVIARNGDEAKTKVIKAYQPYPDFGDYVDLTYCCYIDSKSPDVIETGNIDFAYITK